MTDINPTLDRQAHGASDGGLHLFHHHDRAADHHEKAAEQHRRAAEAHRAGDTAGAATYATQAWGHGAHAEHHANESLKGYAEAETAAEVGASPVATGRLSGVGATGATTAEDTTDGYLTGGAIPDAPTLNPTAANTPGIR